MDVTEGSEVDHNSRHCILIFWGEGSVTRYRTHVILTTALKRYYFTEPLSLYSWHKVTQLSRAKLGSSSCHDGACASHRHCRGLPESTDWTAGGRLNIITIIITVCCTRNQNEGPQTLDNHATSEVYQQPVLFYYFIYYIILDDISFIHSC